MLITWVKIIFFALIIESISLMYTVAQKQSGSTQSGSSGTGEGGNSTGPKAPLPAASMPPILDMAQLLQSYVKYETNLLQDVIGNYSSGMRPVKSSDLAAVINFDMKLKKLVKLDIKEQVMVLEVFVLMRWIDPQLAWDSSSYNNTDILKIPIANVWTPDIELYNNARDTSSSSVFHAPVIATSNGSVVWTNPVVFHASCNIDITWFPLDIQICSLTFGSWSYSHKRLKIMEYNKITESMMKEGKMFVSNGVWIIEKITSKISLQNYACCPDAFSQIEYNFHLKRQPTFFLLYLIFPCFAIIALSLLTFVIPPDAGERIGFGVTVILSFSVYLIVISDKLPEKKNVRKIKVKAFNVEETQKEECYDLDQANDEVEKSKKNDKESHTEQWHQISTYLDKLCCKVIVALMTVAPLVVVKILQKQSDKY
eukprot:gene16550-18227_t